MKISTRISIGYACLIVLMILILAYQLSLIHRMQLINRDLSRVNFNAAELARALQNRLFAAYEDRSKLIATGDPIYEQLWAENLKGFESDVGRLQALDLSEGERDELSRLLSEWAAFQKLALSQSEQIETWSELSPAARQEQSRTLSDILEASFERLEAQSGVLIDQTRLAIRSQVERSAATGERAQWVSWGAATAAVVLSLLVSVLVVGSISAPLRQLTKGTREIAKGRFGYRLQVKGASEFSQLADDFNNMAEKLRELDQMKKDFVSHVSHELKSPLASMQETIRLMLEELPGPLTGKQRRLLELTYQSARRLMAMIRNLLDLARLEAGVMEYDFSEVDLKDLVRTVIDEFEPQLRTKDLHFEAHFPSDPVIVRCDGDRIIQVIGNLVSNAFKYSPPDNRIVVRIQSTDDLPPVSSPAAARSLVHSNNGFVVVAVRDFGPGVPEAHRERIFERFQQVREGQRGHGQGVGLGLAISRSIIEAHGGAIWVESREGEGSTFHFVLQKQPNAADVSTTV